MARETVANKMKLRGLESAEPNPPSTEAESKPKPRVAGRKRLEKESQALTKKILKMLGIEAGIGIETEDSLVKIKIDGSDPGLLIGYRGENLESLQLLLGIMINKKADTQGWHPVLVDVGNWRAQREEALRSLVAREVAKLSPTRNFVELPPMPPAQRRTAHLLVGQYAGLTSESTGEGAVRHIVIKGKEKAEDAT